MTSKIHKDFQVYSEIDDSPILYASLDEQIHRRKSVIENINGRVAFAFATCVDGRDWSEDDVLLTLSDTMQERRAKALAMGRDWLTKGAIACAMTHRSNMIGRITDTGKFLCEDDAILSKSVIDVLASGDLQAALEKLDGITLLDYRSKSDIIAEREPIEKVGKYGIHKVRPNGLGSAACYYVPAKIAPKIVAIQTPISVPVDHWDEMIECGAFSSLYVIHPKPARIGDFPTTIGYKYARKSKILSKISEIKILRRLKYGIMIFRGDFRDEINIWKDKVDE